ncbi:MAG: hypothetical protein KA181_01500 [Xylophilus sp.]|nr:hypothetical protein [Xylophilus sp.]
MTSEALAMDEPKPVLGADFKTLLQRYVEAFIARVTSDSTSQVSISIEPAFALACEAAGIWFKTSFGHGNMAQIPWLACFVAGQSAKLEGVYPVLLYQRATQTASVNFGVSATAEKSSGTWPQEWPSHLIDGLPRFGVKKKGYKQSFVVREFSGALQQQVAEMTDSLLQVIHHFLGLQHALLNKTRFDLGAFQALENAFSEAGLLLDPVAIRRFSVSLLSKKFCILTGLAGSGKTKIAEAFAMWLCASPAQYRIVAVGADWTSNENLLGYADALQTGVYRPPVNGALELILRAHADTTNPYFLILDEMNLSHVERYFADFLSAMESSNAPLSLHGVAAGLQAGGVGGAGGVEVPSSVALPDNLFIIGTVNVDETTYMFSPKVLDRVNVIEFRATAAQMGAFLDDPAGIDLDGLASQGAGFATAFVARAQADADISALVDTQGAAVAPKLKADLLQVFDALVGVGAEFGFRTAKEIARFMVIHKELSGLDWQYKDALDAQVVQKLMPKLHGSARKLDAVLKALDTFATQHALVLTGEKVKRMQERLVRDGFTSFAEA